MRRFLLSTVAALAALSFSPAWSQTPPSVTPKNMIVCGDASTCPWQRGTTSGTITSTPTATADFWYAVGGASSAMTISQASQTGVQGYTKAIQMQRTAANANTATLNLGQVFDTADRAIQLQGKTVCLSFNALAGATFSANGALLTYTITWGTGSNQGYGSMIAGTWTGTATAFTGSATLTTTMNSFSKCGAIPGTATEVGVNFSWVPVGTAGATDYVQINAVQLEAVSPVNPAPTAFENRSALAERNLAQTRALVINEPAASVAVANGGAVSTTVCLIAIPTPVTMRGVPTVTFGGTALSTSTWAVISASATPKALATTYLVQSAIGVNTADMIALSATSAALTAGHSCQLVGAGGGSSIVASADLL